MGQISLFMGILVYMYTEPNSPYKLPHIHVVVGGEKAALSIPDGEVLAISANAITPDLISAKALEGYRLDLVFADGRRGVFDCSPYMQFEFMEGVREPSKFAEVTVDHGTAAWPNGEDLCPDDLYCNLKMKEKGAGAYSGASKS